MAYLNTKAKQTAHQTYVSVNFYLLSHPQLINMIMINSIYAIL